jgi:predicted permease
MYRALLCVFPTRFRREYGADMLQLFRARQREASGWSRVSAWMRLVRDVVIHAPLEHAHQLRSASRIRHAPSSPPPRHVAQKGWHAMLDTTRQDIKYAVRTFVRSPGFTAVAILTLALGIGANTAIFGVINGVLLRPLPLGDPERLTVVWERNQSDGIEKSAASTGIFLDWRERTRTFTDLTAWIFTNFTIQEDDNASIALDGVLVYPNFFDVLRTSPLIGRAFTADDAPPGQRGTVALISYRLWQDRWGADPDIVGRTVRLDGRPTTIVGVMRPDVAAPDPAADVWLPAAFTAPVRWVRHNRSLLVYGRLAPGATIAQAQEDVARIAAELAQGEFADIYEGWDAVIEPMQEQVVGNARATLLVAFATVGLVLLIACVNIANMLLARAAARQREIAVRAALGAGRNRIARQLLTESVLLGLAGGAVGIGFGVVTHRLILTFQPGIIPRAEELHIDLMALGFAVGASLLTGLLFGLAPAAHSLRLDLQDALKQGGGKGATGSKTHNRLRGTLVASQLALATILLCGTGLLTRTLWELGRVDPGFEPDHSVAVRMFLDGRRYTTEDMIRQYYDQLAEQLEATPGITSVGATSALPMDPMGINYDLPYRLENAPELKTNELPSADFRVVTPNYFDTMRIPLMRGRWINDFDRSDGTFVALVNESMAQRAWPDQDPLGQRFETPSTDWQWFEVVGVVGDTRYYGLDTEPRPEIYVAHAQVPRTAMTVVTRTSAGAAGYTDAVRRIVGQQDPAQPAHSVVPVVDLIADTIAAERFYAMVLGVFSAVALILAGAGIYGVLSYWVNQRTQEIGLRIALGATGTTVMRHVVGRGLALTGVGLGVGLVGALIATRVLSSTLYGVGTADPATIAGVSVTLGLIAVVACWVPAFRASRVDPVDALRE